MPPLRGMLNHTGPDHVQINVHYAAMQMLIDLNGCRMISVLPESSVAAFALVELLRSAAGDQLHARCNNVSACVLHQQMNMVGRDGIVEDAQSEALLRLEKPLDVTAPVARKFEEECLSVTAVSYVPDVSWQKVAVGTRHRCRLEGLFRARKRASKPLKPR